MIAVLFLVVLIAMIFSAVNTGKMLDRAKPLWVLIAYWAWVIVLWFLGLGYAMGQNEIWILISVWTVAVATGPIIVYKEWKELAQALGSQWYITLFSKKIEINGKVHLVPPHVTSLHIKKVHNSSYRYDIMFNDEVIISDIVLFDETIATFPRSL